MISFINSEGLFDFLKGDFEVNVNAFIPWHLLEILPIVLLSTGKEKEKFIVSLVC